MTDTTATETTVTVEQNAEQTYDIRSESVARLSEKLAKLAKRAAKLGCPASFSWGAPFRKPVREACRCFEITEGHGCVACNFKGYRTVEREFRTITVSTSRPRLAGWDFLGTLNHTDVKGAVLRKMVPGIECPEYAIAAKPGQCDHCKKIRARLETFVVRHEDGTVRVVGRNCVGDFLGLQSPAMLAAAIEMGSLFGSACEEDANEYDGVGRRGRDEEPTLWALGVAFAVTRVEGGFKPSSFENTATRSIVDSILFPVGGEQIKAQEKFYRDELTVADFERAWKALAWLEAEKPTSDFMHNLRVLAGASHVEPKNLGLFCAITMAFDKELMRRAPKLPSTHVGEVGKRGPLGKGQVERMFAFDNDWGGGSIVLIKLEGGSILKWKSSALPDWVEVGAAVTVTATVKAHTDYKGTPQTEITRAKLERVA